MSLLGSLIQANPQSYFFALEGAGPAPAPVSLTSPVVVIPDGAGNTSISLTAGGTAGESLVAVSGSAGVPGGIGALTVSGFGTPAYRVGVLSNTGDLQIGLNSVAPAVISYDSQNTHQLILGDESAVAGASVQTNVPFIVRDAVNDPTSLNGFGITVDNPATSTIGNGVASNGVLNIGSSQAFPSTLVVSDVLSHGAGNYINIEGASGQVPLFISGSQGSGGVCYMFPDAVPPTASELRFGSDSSNSDVVLISSTAVTVGTLAIPPIYPCSTARVALAPAAGPGFARGQGTYILPISGLPDGMYSLMVYPVPGSAGPTDLNTLGACFTTMFIMKTGLCVYGGVGQNRIGDVYSFPSSGLGSITFNIAVAANYYLAVDFFQLSGTVPGV